MFDLNYLNQLITNKIEESPELEYKAALALQKESKKVIEISKDVSSFANSNGGVLIYGIAEDQANKQVPSNIDPIDRRVISREWLEQIINSRIRPRIHGLKIHVVVMPDNNDQVVYILEIPKGETAHQADDRRYYRRHNFTIEQLLDHEIRDIMGRQKNAEIIVGFDITKRGNYKRGIGLNTVLDEHQPYLYSLNIYAENIGKIYVKYINIVLTLPKRCVNVHDYRRNDESIHQIKADNKVRDLVEPDGERYYTPIVRPKQYASARYEPILPGMRVKLTSTQINEYSINADNNLSWVIYADNAEPKSGEIALGRINQS